MSDQTTVTYICRCCGTESTYWRADDCDHTDWHVTRIAVPDVPCGECLEAYVMWLEMDLYVDQDHVEALIRSVS